MSGSDRDGVSDGGIGAADKNGRYRLAHFNLGSYFLMASASHSIGEGRARQWLFEYWRNAIDFAGATPINLAPRDRLDACPYDRVSGTPRA